MMSPLEKTMPAPTRRLFFGAGAALLLPGLALSAFPQTGHAAEEEAADADAGEEAQTALGPLAVAARWAFAMDVQTGTTLLDKGGKTAMPPSSMTKLMTIYIVYQHLKSGRLRLDQLVPVSERAWRMKGSRMFVEVGTSVSVEDLIRGVVVASGNDAAVVLAEAIAGSESAFVELMNAEAARLGMESTNFRNSTGMPDPDHQMSCRDIAVLARQIITEFPEFYHYESDRSFTFNGIEQFNRNPLVQRGVADGLKTGHTDAGGYGLCASALRDGRRVIVVMNGMASSSKRASEGTRVMNWCFSSFENAKVFSGTETVGEASVWLGTSDTVPLVAGNDVVLTMPRDWRHRIKAVVSHDSPIAAPIAMGLPIGRLSFSGVGLEDKHVPLQAGASVARLGLPGRAFSMMEHYANSALGSLWPAM